MNSIEQARFEPQYREMRQTLVPQGKRPKTVDAYSRAVRRIAAHFDRCPDRLTTAEPKA